jgi:hypothetical protein
VSVETLEFKAFPTGRPEAYTQVIGAPHEGVDPETGTPVGVVEAIVAVTGVVDEVGDVFVPGSFRRTIGEIKAKGVSAHDWKIPVSKALEAEEWMPGDTRLPATLPNGKPWPSEAGAVYVKALHNLRTEAGRTAYENALFYGADQNYSVGYKVRPGGAVKKGGIRYIRDHDWYEWSDVLHGANRLAHLLSVKADLTSEIERTGFKLPVVDSVVAEPEHTGGMIALVPSEVDLERIGTVSADAEPKEDLHLTLLYLGPDVTGWPADAGDTIAALLMAASPGMAPVKARVMGHGLLNPDGGPDGDDDPCAVYLVGDSPEITKVRTWLSSVLADGPYPTPPPQRDPMIPHITAGYGVPVDQLTFAGPVTFDRIRLALAGDVTDVPLGEQRMGLLDDEYKSILAEIETKDVHSGSVGTSTVPASLKPGGKTCKFCTSPATTRLERDGRVLPTPVCRTHKHGAAKALPVEPTMEQVRDMRTRARAARADSEGSSYTIRRADGVEVKVMSPDPRAAKLREYWAHGEGRRKWRPGSPGDFKRLRRLLAKHIENPRVLDGLTANIHKLATGEWPGKRAHGTKALPMPEHEEPTTVDDLDPMDDELVEGVEQWGVPFEEEDTTGYDFADDFFVDAEVEPEVSDEEIAALEGAPAGRGAPLEDKDEEDVEEEPAEPTGEEPAEPAEDAEIEEDEEDDDTGFDPKAYQAKALLSDADMAEFLELKAIPDGAIDDLTLNLERLALAEDTLVTREEAQIDDDAWTEVVARDRQYRIGGDAQLRPVDNDSEHDKDSVLKDGVPVPAASSEVALLD